jgi:CubicO group peptidase (beta-lactamase class C family)
MVELAPSTEQSSPWTDRVLAEVSELVAPLQRDHVVPGVSLGLVSREGSVLAGFGLTNVEHPLPVDGDTVFQIASITKTFTAVAVIRLVEAGRLDLDVPVISYLPEFRLQDHEATKRITLRHLLTHSGGFFGDHFLDTGPGDDALARYVASMADLPQFFPPGSMWSANNADFCLAGRVIEVITGQTYERAITSLVLQPLGMNRSFFFTSDAATHRFAVGHFVVDGKAVVTRPKPNVRLRPIAILPRSSVPTGGLLSTARDMLRYVRSLLGMEAILERESLELMGSPLVPGAWDQWRGIPWLVKDVGEHRILSHGGGGARSGQRALLVLAPRAGAGLIVLTNAGPVGAFVHDAIAEWWLTRVVGVEGLSGSFTPTGSNVQTHPALPEEIRPFIGSYASPDTDVEVTADPTDEGLLRLVERTRRKIFEGGYDTAPPAPPTVRIGYCGDNRFVVLDGPTKGAPIEFLRAADGTVTFVWMDHGRVHRRQ